VVVGIWQFVVPDASGPATAVLRGQDSEGL
jgi:hypothetical protein